MTKIPAINRIKLLLDTDTFQETDGNVSQSVISGLGKVGGRDVCIYAQNSAVKGGSLGKAHARRIINIMRIAMERHCPIIAILDSGGARIQEGVDSLAGYGEIFRLCAQAKGKVLQLGLILGSCAGGAAYSPALMDFVFTVKDLSKMFINGPAVIKSNTGEDVDSESLGGAYVSAAISGNAHFIHNTEEECISEARKLLCITGNIQTPETTENAPSAPITSESGVHDVMAHISDGGCYMETRKLFAPNCVTALSRIGGKTVGIVGNHSAVMNGDIDIDAADKIADFVRFCNDFGLPIITLVDIKSFKCSREQENRGLIRHGARIIQEYSTSTVKKITVIMRQSLGGGYVAMGSKSLGADVVMAWEGASIAVMKPEAAVSVIYRKELAANPEMRDSYLKKYTHEISNIDLSNYIDQIIAPQNTRLEILKHF
ncbi:MAG: methylmalonyl-CoA carboxyltransferase [Bacteroidales bacterium]|nr:methylmalonyl-CoA carboxyltransferase [Bacteroidales bacterium]